MKRSSKFSSETQNKFKTFAFALYDFLIEWTNSLKKLKRVNFFDHDDMDHRTAKDDMADAKSSYPAISLSVMFFTY